MAHSLCRLNFIASLFVASAAIATTEADSETRIYELPLLVIPHNNGRAPNMKQVYGELKAISKGWVAGNEYLDSKAALCFGLTKVIETNSR